MSDRRTAAEAAASSRGPRMALKSWLAAARFMRSPRRCGCRGGGCVGAGREARIAIHLCDCAPPRVWVRTPLAGWLVNRSSVRSVCVHRYGDGRWRWAASSWRTNPIAVSTTSWLHRETAVQEARAAFPGAFVYFS